MEEFPQDFNAARFKKLKSNKNWLSQTRQLIYDEMEKSNFPLKIKLYHVNTQNAKSDFITLKMELKDRGFACKYGASNFLYHMDVPSIMRPLEIDLC